VAISTMAAVGKGDDCGVGGAEREVGVGLDELDHPGEALAMQIQ
jgi:hypothetical protein